MPDLSVFHFLEKRAVRLEKKKPEKKKEKGDF